MGFFFSNLQIHKTEAVSLKTIEPLLKELMERRGFRWIANTEDADLTISAFDKGGKWISICSDDLDFYAEETVQDLCNPISQQFSTDVITISCFDSDCLLLNLINDDLGINAWAKTGHYPGIKQRSAPKKWRELVGDIEKFQAILQKKPVFAEEALEELEPLLGLFPGQGCFCTELISETQFAGSTQTLCFALPKTDRKQDPPCLTIPHYSLMPCEIGQPSFIYAVNTGGKSSGLAIAFSGSYVEREEIWFRDVQLEYAFDRYPRPTIQLQLEKRQAQDGKWIYYAEVPQFQIPPGVKEGLPTRRAMDEESKRCFGLRFTPGGNERKRLDITLHFIPLKNPAGQCGWCVWLHSGSKRAYIEDYNKTWSAHQPHGPKLLDIDSLDIDE